MPPTTRLRGRSHSGIDLLLQGASQPFGEPLEADLGYLAGCDDHVVNSWFQFNGVCRGPESSLDAIASHRRAATPRDHQAETGNAGRPFGPDHDEPAAALALAVSEDSTKVPRVA